MMENKTKIDLKNKSVFITGAAGFIGSNLAKRLLSTVEGVKVVGLDNMNHYYLRNSFFNGSIRCSIWLSDFTDLFKLFGS